MAGTIVLDKIQLDNGITNFQFVNTTGVQLVAVSSSGVTLPDGGLAASQQKGVFTENGQTLSTNYTVTTNKSAMAVGPITIAAGVSVTIPANSRLVIL
jgi:hypothetical protein